MTAPSFEQAVASPQIAVDDSLVDGPPISLTLPGTIERIVVWAASFTLLHGLPLDWFQTREQSLAVEGNLRMVIVQLALMSLGILRVIGSFDWILRVIRLDAALFGFVSVAALSTFWSADPGETFRQAVILITVTLFGAYLVLRFALAEILQIWALVFVASVAVNYAIIFALPVYGVAEQGQWDGVFTQKNALGWIALVGIPTLLLAGRSMLRMRAPYYLSAVGMGGLLLGSQSKTMLLATGGTLGLMFTYRLFRGRQTVRGILYLTLLGVVGGMIALTMINLNDLTELLDRDVTFTGRIPLWELLLPFAMAEPLLGYGYQAVFTGYFGPIHEVWVLERWNPSHAHNELLNLWLQVGLVGVCFYLFSLLRALKRATNVVQVVSGGAGLWPVVFISSAILVSISESGMSNNSAGWMMLVVAVLSAGHHSAQLDGADTPN